MPGLWASIKIRARSGGSSIIFSNELAAEVFNSSAASTIATLHPPSTDVCEKKVEELNKEIETLKKGIKESIEELEDFIEEQNA